MGMTIEERIAQLVRVKHYASPKHYETLDVAIETMRKYQKIEKIYHMFNEVNDFPLAMWNIGGVLDENNNR